VVLDRLDDAARLLRGVGAVEVDQRLPVGRGALEDREIGADGVDVVRDGLLGRQRAERRRGVELRGLDDVRVLAGLLGLVGPLQADVSGNAQTAAART
jgi:hypothetical protein